MEEDQKILKVVKISNHHHFEILKLALDDQVYKYFRWRWPPMEDDFKILKVESISNHWYNLSSNFRFETNFANTSNEDNLQRKTPPPPQKKSAMYQQIKLLGGPWNL